MINDSGKSVSLTLRARKLLAVKRRYCQFIHQMATLFCKLLQLIRETKLTLTLTLNPKTKLTLKRGTNPTKP